MRHVLISIINRDGLEYRNVLVPVPDVFIDGSDQEVFDHVVRHCAAQKVRSSVPLATKAQVAANGQAYCRYRYETAEGVVLRCAIGSFWNDDQHHVGLESNSVDQLFGTVVSPERLSLLSSLQVAHDSCGSAEQLRNDFYYIAQTHGLDDSTTELISEWHKYPES